MKNGELRHLKLDKQKTRISACFENCEFYRVRHFSDFIFTYVSKSVFLWNFSFKQCSDNSTCMTSGRNFDTTQEFRHYSDTSTKFVFNMMLKTRPWKSRLRHSLTFLIITDFAINSRTRYYFSPKSRIFYTTFLLLTLSLFA